MMTRENAEKLYRKVNTFILTCVGADEAFRDEVEKNFKQLNPGMDDKTAETYINSEEATTVIKDAYESDKREYEAGEITRNVFMNGGVASAAYCLYMMY